MKRVLLLAVVLLALGASQAQASGWQAAEAAAEEAAAANLLEPTTSLQWCEHKSNRLLTCSAQISGIANNITALTEPGYHLVCSVAVYAWRQRNGDFSSGLALGEPVGCVVSI